jgi:hypothetical protein
VREQQHWASLGRHFAWSAAASFVAWLTVQYLFAGAPHAVRLAVGAAVLAGVYAATNWRNRA